MSRIRSAAVLAAAMALALSAIPGAASAAQPAGAAKTAAASTPIDLARTATPSASGVELDDPARFGVGYINDGDSSTRWSSNYSDSAWVQLELAAPAKVHSIEIDWPNACARAFQLQTSTDGQTWTTVEERTASTCPRTDEVVLDLSEAVKFIRMQGAKRWGAYGYSISTIRVWDAPKPEPVRQLPLVPQPVSVDRAEGSYSLGSSATILAMGDAAAAGTLLAEVLRPSTGFPLAVVDSASAAADNDAAAISIEVGAGLAPAGHDEEGYKLDVDASGIRIRASAPAGALNGVQTLRQLLPAWAESDQRADIDWTVPFVSIEDYPRFEHRGFMVDTARSFYTVDEVKRIIDSVAPLKLNRLHLHLTDDQGWRIAMRNPAVNPSSIDFTLLTEISGKTAMTYNREGQLMGTELGRTGFYSQADYLEIIRYAGANGMTVIPEIDLPGHTTAALHAIPQLNSAGSLPKPRAGEITAPAQGTGDVGGSSFDANNDATYRFIDEVLAQLAELTPGEYLHIGGDEAHNTAHADYVKMVDYATAKVAALGKTVVGWNEYAGTALPEGRSVVQLWTGNGASAAAAVRDRGAKVVLSPANKTYYPQKQDPRQPVGGTWACGGACTLENAYSWNPANQISGVGDADILGVEGAFWGEFIRGVDQAQFYSFPRVLATAEAGWTPQSEKDSAEFMQRVGDSGPRMAMQGINFFPTATVKWAADAAPTVTIADGAGAATRAVQGVAPVAATVDWRIVAPATFNGSLTGQVTWSDGVTEEVAVSATGTSDVAGMSLDPVYTTVSQRAFEEPGTYSAQLTIAAGTGATASASAVVEVVAAAQPGDPDQDEGGTGEPGTDEPGTGADEDTPTAPGAGSRPVGGEQGMLATTGAESWPLAAAGAAAVLIAVVLLLRRRVARD